MKEVLLEEIVERESGYLYFIDGRGSVCRSPMHVGGKKGLRVKKVKTKEEIAILNAARQKKWRAKQKEKNININKSIDGNENGD